jgi:hypothetical protein
MTASERRPHPMSVQSGSCAACVAVWLMVSSSHPSKPAANEKVVLIYLSPGDIFSETTEALPPPIRNCVAQNRIKKLTWLIDVINQSGNGVLVTAIECPQCGRPFTGQDGPKNRERHLKRNCEFTKSRSDYRHVCCPYPNCGQIFTRSDNLHPHIKRKHSA